MKAEIRRGPLPPASNLPELISFRHSRLHRESLKSVGYIIAVLCIATWPTPGLELGVGHELCRERAKACPRAQKRLVDRHLISFIPSCIPLIPGSTRNLSIFVNFICKYVNYTLLL